MPETDTDRDQYGHTHTAQIANQRAQQGDNARRHGQSIHIPIRARIGATVVMHGGATRRDHVFGARAQHGERQTHDDDGQQLLVPGGRARTRLARD